MTLRQRSIQSPVKRLYTNCIISACQFVRFIQKIYEKTAFLVWNWDGKEVSEEFLAYSYSDVKQGCLLPPLVFALYLDDLHEFLGEGTNFKDINIRLLLYADDIVILTKEINVLQKIVYKL